MNRSFITTGIAAILALLAITALLIINISSRETLNLEIAVLIEESKLKSDMIHFESLLKAEYGELRLQNGELLDKRGDSLAYHYRLVDHLSNDLGIVASILIKENNDYRRIATSISDSEGNRAVDTFLGSGSAAYAPIQAGAEYIGKAVILGKEYLSIFRSIFQPDTNEVIGALSVSVEMAAIKKIIEQKSNIRTIQTIIIRTVLIALGTLLAVIFINILLRISAEKHDADKRTQLMLDATPLCANFWDKNFNHIDCNQEAVKLFELSGKKEYSDRFFELSPEYQPDGIPSKDRAIELVKKAFEEGYCRFEWMHQKLNGEPIPCEVTLVRIEHKNDFVVVGYTRDLRELKSSIQQMNESKRSLNIMLNILNGMNAMFFVNVPDTCEILFINEPMKKHYGVKDDGIGQLCYKIFLRDAEKKCDFCPCHRLDQEPDSTVVWEFHNPLTNRIYQNTDRYIEWPDGKIVHIQHSVDVTELIEAKEQAERSNRYKNQFLSHMSHEIRTPMNSILGITEIQLENETLSPDTNEAFGKIYNSGYMLLGIINDILDFSKIEAGKLELVPTGYDVLIFISEIAHLNFIRYNIKPIEFILDVDENIPSMLYGDELRIRQVLNNLLSNAFKYTESGQIMLSAYGEYTGQDDQIILIFRVSDTGQGMTGEQLDKLFDEYTRFNTGANRLTEGTGLGMSITKHLVNIMGGDISVESDPGKGSAFTVRLPQGIVNAEVLGREVTENLRQFRFGRPVQVKKAQQIIREYMPYGRVLIVDDVESNLYVAKGLLTPYGLSIETATSGFEAIDKIKNGATFDIIFMDHYMPKMDGLETVKIIRGLGYTQPIIALTANALAGQSEMFMENGFDWFISKPIDIRQLNASLNKLIRDKYPPEVVEAARQQAAKINATKTAALEKQQASGTELAAIFVRDAEKAIAMISSTIANTFRRSNDIRQYVINVHSMKSALANIGENELSSVALKLEQAGREEDMAVIMSETPAFLEALHAVVKKNKPKKGDIIIDDSENLAYLAGKLAVIQTACEKYDETTANTALTELRQRKWTHPVKDQLDTLAEHLLHSDFEEAAKLAKNFLQSR